MKNAKMRVYGWSGFRQDLKTTHRQSREIVAARSMAEVARLAGQNSPSKLCDLGETGNAGEIAQAMGEPGVIFYRALDGWSDRWRRA